MNKQTFITSVVSHYLKGYKLLVFVDRQYKMFKFSLYNYMTMETLEKLYDTFKIEIDSGHYEFFEI